jgi:1-aminocyclopropane-1-carboxylate deaminase/D-cysteine desulfhydrase-like pyridoxal-dependent ACC family enzyme
MPLDESDVESYDEYVETAYGEPSPGGLAAMRLAAHTEGLMLDPIYTGKAMAGLIGHAREGRFTSDDVVVFLHTGGSPALFAYHEEAAQSFASNS